MCVLFIRLSQAQLRWLLFVDLCRSVTASRAAVLSLDIDRQRLQGMFVCHAVW